MEINTLKGFTYVATAKTDATITDDNGLNLLVKAGGQGTFIATADKVAVTGSATITQTRNFKGALALNAGGGKGEVIQPGEVIIGGTQGSYSWFNMNEAYMLPFVLPAHIPEGVTLEQLTTVRAQPPFSCDYIEAFRGLEDCELPASINLSNLFEAEQGFYGNGYIKRINASDGLFGQDNTIVANYMFAVCDELESFEGDLTMLGYADYMFYQCRKLKHFRATATVNNLYRAHEMFYGCVLDWPSLQNIATTFNRAPGGSPYITIGYDANTVTTQQAQSVQDILVGKGWSVNMQRNFSFDN